MLVFSSVMFMTFLWGSWIRWVWWWWIMDSNILYRGDMMIAYWAEKWKWSKVWVFYTYMGRDTNHREGLRNRVDYQSGVPLTTVIRVCLQHSYPSVVCVHGPTEKLVVRGGKHAVSTIMSDGCLQFPQRVHIVVSPYRMDVRDMALF